MQRVSCDEGSGTSSQQLQRIAARKIRLHFGLVFAHGGSWPESDCSRAGIVAGGHLRWTGAWTIQKKGPGPAHGDAGVPQEQPAPTRLTSWTHFRVGEWQHAPAWLPRP